MPGYGYGISKYLTATNIAASSGPSLPQIDNGHSMTFDGVDDYTQAEIPVDGYNAATLRTFSLWVKIDSLTVGGYTPIMGGGPGYAAYNVFQFCNSISIHTSLGVSKLRWALYSMDAGANSTKFESEAIDGSGSAPNLIDGDWHHVVVYNPVVSTALQAAISNCKIWLDGSPLTGTSTALSTVRGFIADVGKPCNVVLGAGYSGGQKYLDGNIDEFAYWNRELSDAEVLSIYNATTTALTADLNELSGGKPDAWYRMGD